MAKVLQVPVETDETLTQSGMPADSKIVGDNIDELKKRGSVLVSEEAPTTEDVQLWIDENESEEFSVPEIKDNEENSSDTWSSSKIAGEISELKGDLGHLSLVYEKKAKTLSIGKNYFEFTCNVGNIYKVTNGTSGTVAVRTMMNGEIVQVVREALISGGSFEFECTNDGDTIYVYANELGNFYIENLSTWYHITNKNLKNLSIFLNAKDYGVSTDSIDNHDAIVNAISDAMTQGKPLYFEAGTYITSEIELTYPNQLRIIGTGYNKGKATILKPKTGSKIFTFYGGNNCFFEKIYFQGSIILADNSPDTADCRFNNLYFDDCNFLYNGYGVKIDSPCGYIKFERCGFKCTKGIAIGENYTNTASVIPNYIYILNCEFFGITDVNSCGVSIYQGRVVKIQNCDFAGFNTEYPSISIYAYGVVDYLDITENMFMNNLYPIRIRTAPDSGYIQRVRINYNGFELSSGGKGVYVDGGATSGGFFELQVVGNYTSGALSDQITGYVFSVNNVNTLTFAQNEAHALLLAKDCVLFTNVNKLTDKAFMSDNKNFSLNAGESKTIKFGYKGMWCSADKDIWHTGNNVTYTKSYNEDTNELIVIFTNNSEYAQNIHADLM